MGLLFVHDPKDSGAQKAMCVQLELPGMSCGRNNTDV